MTIHTDSRTRLINAAQTYKEKTGRALSGVSMEVVNDHKFLDRFIDGAGCTIDTFDKFILWFQQNTPQEPKKSKKLTTKN